MATIRIFISSPGDVRPERLKAEQIVARLSREFSHHLHLQTVLWEREPLVASRHFQDPLNIPQPRQMEIVVVILWSRLGLLLPPDQFRGAIGGMPVTGTEWEFEDALAGARATGTPDLLVYRKAAEPSSGLGNRAAVQERLEQIDKVEAFIAHWFHGDGKETFTAALHSFSTTTEFEEQLYQHLHALLERHTASALKSVSGIRWHDAPFRGLLPFEFEHAPVFFGRTRARNELRELLGRRGAADCSFVLVLGASGSGKSSLVKAGLLPDLMLPGMIGRVALVRRGVMRPSEAGDNPIAALANAILSATALPELATLQYTPERLTEMLLEAPGQAALPIRQGLAAAGEAAGLTEIAEARLALVIDQLEELFTIESLGQPARETFLAALEALARSDLVWVIATMRSDFFDRLEALPRLAALSAGEARYLLLPPGDPEIGQIIRRPALEAGLRFEVDPRGIGLDEYIRQAAAAGTGTLPLLSFLLDQLWRRRGEGGVLTFAAYEDLGRLEGAIGRRAEEVFQAQPRPAQDEFARTLRALATVEGVTAASRPAPLSQFPRGTPRRDLVDAFLDPEARLLVADASSGEPHLRLAHEALLTHWTRARDQIAADARDLELRGRLEKEAERWRAAPRCEKGQRVGAGLLLAEARALVERWGGELPESVLAFVTASRRAANRRQRQLVSSLVGAIVALPVLAVLAWAGMVWFGVRTVESELAFVRISPGCFAMGSPDSEMERHANEGPVHQVCVKTFDLGTFEVTQGAWRRIMLQNRYPSQYEGDDHPVENVSWDDAQTFVRLMSFFGRYTYRLPTESEWEYAARAGTKTARYWGDRAQDGCPYENMMDQSLRDAFPDVTIPVPDSIFVHCDDKQTSVMAVGSFKPNPFGFHDMLGNVAEWVEDCYAPNYDNAPNEGSAVNAKDCTVHVIRGGSWIKFPSDLRSANRISGASDFRSYLIGFRLARTAGR